MDPWIEVNLSHLAWNIRQIKRAMKVPLMVVVKSNAYGHGLEGVARCLAGQGIRWLLAGKIEEAVDLKSMRRSCRVLNYGPFSKHDCEPIIRNGIIQAVYTDDVFHLSEAAVRFHKKATVHISIDTGLGREGFPYKHAWPLIEKISSLKGIEIQGISTTLSEDHEFDKQQLRLFLELCSIAKKKGIHLGIRHAASSDGMLSLAESRLDMVRPGISVYGYYPSSQTQKEDRLRLKPVLALKARISMIKDLTVGESLSYHRSYTAREKEKIANVHAGYADGYPDVFGGIAAALIHKNRFPVIAAVTANHLWIRIRGRGNIRPGDEVVLINNRKEEGLTADELAAQCGISVYKILFGLNPLLPRIYLR